jgi:hypothetical protein
MLIGQASDPIYRQQQQALSCGPRLRPLRQAIAAKGCMGGSPPIRLT